MRGAAAAGGGGGVGVDWVHGLGRDVWSCWVMWNLSVADMVQLEQTCRRLWYVCTQHATAWWCVQATRSLLPYDHRGALQHALATQNWTMVRRWVKGWDCLCRLTRRHPGDEHEPSFPLAAWPPLNCSAARRMSHWLRTVPSSYLLVYFCAMSRKPRREWRLVFGHLLHERREPGTAHRSGWVWLQFEPKPTSPPPHPDDYDDDNGPRPLKRARHSRRERVACEFTWCFMSATLREFLVLDSSYGLAAAANPGDGGGGGRVQPGVYQEGITDWAHPLLHARCWTTIVHPSSQQPRRQGVATLDWTGDTESSNDDDDDNVLKHGV